jgi:hypothetical protein
VRGALHALHRIVAVEERDVLDPVAHGLPFCLADSACLQARIELSAADFAELDAPAGPLHERFWLFRFRKFTALRAAYPRAGAWQETTFIGISERGAHAPHCLRRTVRGFARPGRPRATR